MKRKILLNPGPGTTTNTVKQAMVVPDICPREREFGDIINEVRSSLLRVVHGEETHDTVFIPGSGTATIEAVLSSVVPDKKKILVIKNGNYGRRMHEIAQIYYGTERTLALTYGDECPPDLTELENMLAEHQDISHLAVVHHETTTGLLNPIEDVYKLCRAKKIEIVIDAMSSFAGLPIDLRSTNFDYVISSSNKCVQGMAGIGFAIASKTSLEALSTITPKNYYLNLSAHYEFMKREGQLRFTPPVQVFYALKQALLELFAEGVEARYQRYESNWSYLLANFERLGLETLVPKALHSKICTAIKDPQISGHSFQKLHQHFAQHDITVYPGSGGSEPNFRISNLGDLHLKDMETVIEVLESYLEGLG